MTAALAGLGSGALHALSGPDHLLGVAPHAIGRRTGAWRVGFAWGAGHAAGTVASSSLLLAAAAAAQVAEVERWAERGAGFALVAVGVLGLLALRRARLDPMKATPRAGRLGALLAVGVLHGALGAAALVLVIAGTAAPGLERVLFLSGFSAGSTAAMALLAAGLARAARAPRLAALLQRVPRVASVTSIVVGAAWAAGA
jgi:cytochrome c biogenesis protein CcdA